MTLGGWKYKIGRAMALQETMHKQWNDAVDLVACTYFEKIYGGFDKDRVDVNFANWYFNNLLPLVYFRDPFIFIKSKHSKYEAFADTMEKVVNYYWKELSLKQEFKRVISSGFLMPPGWIKIGYTAKIGQDIAELEEKKDKNLIKDVKDAILNIFRNKDKEEKTLEEQGVLNEYIKEENIFACWIPSWNMLIPEGYQLIHKMPYLIEIEDLPLVDFKANPLYKNKKNIKPSSTITSSSSSLHKPGYQEGDDNEQATIRLFHIEDKRSRKRFTLSMEGEFPHFEGEMVCPEGFSYEPLYFEELLPSSKKANPYPPNIFKPILPQIIEQSSARTQMGKHRKRSGAIIMAQKGLASDEDMAQIEETDQIQIIQVSNLSAFSMTQTPALPPDVFRIDGVIKEDLQMGTNMGQLMFAPMPGQRTATQAQIGQSGLQLKASARVDCVEEFTVKVARKIVQFAWYFLSKEKVEEIIGDTVTNSMWWPLPDNEKERKKIIQSELELNIDVGSAAPPKDETIDRKQILDFVSIISSIAPERLRKDEIVKQLSKRFKFVKDVNKIIFSNDDKEIATASLENQYMLQGFPQAVSPNENHDIHFKTHQEIAGNELGDKHSLEHAAFMGIISQSQSGVGNSPQRGDLRPPMKSVNPERMREGLPEEAGVYQSVQNLGVGSGEESI